MLSSFFEKYGHQKQIKKGDFLYSSNKNDTNIYYIKKGKFLLKKDNQKIAIIQENEISGEKSFLNKTSKPIDAIALDDSNVFYLSQEDFEKLEPQKKEEFLKLLTLFISDRVYLLNSIINNISFISNLINKEIKSLDINYFKKLFEKILNIDSIFIYEIYEGSILPLFTSEFSPDIEQKIKNQAIQNDFLNISEKSIIFKTNNFIFYINGAFKQPNYIVNNTLIHSLTNFRYLAEKIKNLKENELSNFLK